GSIPEVFATEGAVAAEVRLRRRCAERVVDIGRLDGAARVPAGLSPNMAPREAGAFGHLLDRRRGARKAECVPLDLLVAMTADRQRGRGAQELRKCRRTQVLAHGPKVTCGGQ